MHQFYQQMARLNMPAQHYLALSRGRVRAIPKDGMKQVLEEDKVVMTQAKANCVDKRERTSELPEAVTEALVKKFVAMATGMEMVERAVKRAVEEKLDFQRGKHKQKAS